MARKLRVFISSTMKDLANERRAVVDRLTQFNCEPVNAENWSPTGAKSWSQIEQEIQSSNLFVLILGDRYGWIPNKGPKAGLGLSVTHLEYDKARELGLQILPFFKRLDYDTERTSDDAKKRDAFRDEVKDWENGVFTREFDLAPDLAAAVGESVITVLSDEFLKARITERSDVAARAYLVLAEHTQKPQSSLMPVIPQALVKAVATRQAVLFAGSGISLTAGLPSASAFAQRLIQLLREIDPQYEVNPVGTAFAGVATDLEAARGREFLVDAVVGLIHPPQGIEPTSGHLHAARLFDQIFTTNYDSLFEDAVRSQGLASTLIAVEPQTSALPPRAIVKLHGSADAANSLLLTERDVFGFDRTRPRLWQATVETFKRHPVVVVGASLRDPSIVRLFTEVGELLSGFFVAPYLWEWTPDRLSSWNIQCIEADADTFMHELAQQVMPQGGRGERTSTGLSMP